MPQRHPTHNAKAGFTLVELAIGLVVIGFIIGAIFVARDLIQASEVRSTIAQLQKYQSAVQTFRLKFNALPGDIRDPDASAFGFHARGTCAGQSPCLGEGDGNGLIEGIQNNGANDNYGIAIGGGETAMFWVDLSAANLIDANLTTAGPDTLPGSTVTQGSIATYVPTSKLAGNYFYVFSWAGANYFGLEGISSISVNGFIGSTPTVPVSQAYNIDQKIDDGWPTSGRVLAVVIFGIQIDWANAPPWQTAANAATSTNNVAASASSCFDNNNVGGVIPHYTTQVSNGAGNNCSLVFLLQ